MTVEVEADTVIVGSGISGVLVARALLAAGQRVAMIERGGYKSHADQLRTGTHSTGSPGTLHNHVTAPGTPDYPWNYVYGVGGSTLHWDGTTPRFSSGDFRMKSDYGIMRDWPFGLDELLPYYREAERLLGIAGAPDGDGMPPHPFSKVDEVLRPLLAPYIPLPQARPTEAVGKRPACCGSARCELCPVDSRFSVINTFEEVLEHPRLRLLTDTVVDSLALDRAGSRVTAVRCVNTRGSRFDAHAPAVVLAASGFENTGMLLRSGLERPDLGRYLFDHAHRTLHVRVSRDVGSGYGTTQLTGVTDGYRDGPWRRKVSASALSALNLGVPPREDAIADAIVAGRRGREAYLDEWRHTIVFDAVLEDVPRPERRVTLSKERDALGLPKLQVAYPPASDYEEGGWRRVQEDVRRRLAPLGVRDVKALPGTAGGHLLGTCRMGSGDDGVVDSDLRHLDVENLHVTGGSAFPTYSPIQPTLTIAALALRLGRRLTTEARPAG